MEQEKEEARRPRNEKVKRNKKKKRSLFLQQSSYILDVVGTFWMLGSSRAFDNLLITISVSAYVRDKPAT